METKIDNVIVIYPDEDEGYNRDLKIWDDTDSIQIDFIDSKLNDGG